MSRKNWIFIVVLAALAGVYVVFFTDWFRPRTIEIFHTSRFSVTPRGGRVKAANADTEVVLFGLGQRYRLTDLKVVPLAEWQTNHEVLPMWHLISDSNSVPVKSFPYGAMIRGMKPAVARQWPKPLEPNVTYRLFVTAGSATGRHDFTTVAKPGGK